MRVGVNEQSQVVHHDDYDPFGLSMPGRSMVTNAPKERFTGHELDDESGFYYAGARCLDPVIGRWNGVDPLAGDYPEWSPYNYVFNGPLNWVDPDGLYPTCGEENQCDDIYEQDAVVSNRFGEFVYLGNNQWRVVRFGQAEVNITINASKLAEWAQALPAERKQGSISPWIPDLWDTWSESSNFIARTTYALVDAPWVAFQTLNPFDETSSHINGALATPKEQLNAGVEVISAIVGGQAVRVIRAGREPIIGGVRVAIFGNKTGHRLGRYPHYHRRRIDPRTGQSTHGQGIGRHRPWEGRPSDRNFWDRF